MRTVSTIVRAHKVRLGAFAIACLCVLVPAFAQQQGPVQVNSQGVTISFQNTGGDATVSKGVGLSFQNTGGDATVSRGVSILFNNQGGNAVGSNGTTISFQNAQDASSGTGVTIGFTNSCALSCTATAPTTGAVGASISFGSAAGSTAPVTGCGGSVTYDWNFGDRTPHSTQPNPTHTYNSAGIYSWTLTTNVSGASACVKTGRITIDPPGQYCLTTSVSPAGAGTVTAGGCYSRAAFVFLQATPALGYKFGFWSGDVTGTTTYPTANIQMTRNKNLVANFTPVATTFSGTIRIADGQNFWPLNGDGVVCLRVSARPQGGGISSEVDAAVERSTATYTFTSLPAGSYDVSVAITYKDRVSENTSSLFRGCYDQTFLKTTVYKKTIDTAGLPDPDIYLPSPLVMVHGISSCYQKWYSVDSIVCSDRLVFFDDDWDNFARGEGFITFTPNYYWLKDSTHPWELLAGQVLSQVTTNLRALSQQSNGGKYPPWVYIGHSQGGLVARVLTSGDNGRSSAVRSIQKIYLLGTPNSGTFDTPLGIFEDFFARIQAVPAYLLSQPMRRDFNVTYDSFGIKDSVVSVFAGNSILGTDVIVPVDSVHNIFQRFCSLGFCVERRNRFFTGYDFPYYHWELGSVQSLNLLSLFILPDVGMAPTKPITSSAPTTVTGVTIEMRGVSSQQRSVAASQTDSFPFTVGATDRVEVSASLFTGTATFSLVNPSGQVVDFTSIPLVGGQHVSSAAGDAFVLHNPVPGTWTLTTVAGPSATTYKVDVGESSPLGFEGYVAVPAVLVGQAANLIGQWSGDGSGVTSPLMTAQLKDESGAAVGSATLHDDGAHGDGTAGDGVFGGDTPALANTGRYTATFTAQGVYNGHLFTRSAEASVDVISSSHLFTGDFNDGVYDSDEDGNFDTLQQTVVITAMAAGSFLVSADLEDAQGYFVGHAVGHFPASTAGTYSVSMEFDLRGATCGQFSSPFSIKNLTLIDGASLKALDIWTANVTTQPYGGSLFGCASGTPTPTVNGVQPGAMFPGDSKQVIINGQSFQNGAQVSFGAGVTVSSVTFGSSTTLVAQVSVSAGAMGARDVTVTNPDGRSSTGIALFNVASDQPPAVSINNISDGQTITGVVTVSARATDDIGIQKVEFYFDGVLQTSDTTFPYQFVWNTYGSSNAPHTLLAKAYDTANHTTNAQITVNVSCVTTYSPSSLFFPLSGGSGAVNVSSANACSWEVTASDAWVSITSASIGSGSDVVTFEIRENFTASARTATLSIGGKPVTIVQDGGLGEDCQYSISPMFTSFSASGGTGAIQVFAAERCAWQATTSESFITLTSSGVGIGNGTVSYSVGINPAASGRKGTITIAGQSFSVKQKGN